jgi:putative membrane protein
MLLCAGAALIAFTGSSSAQTAGSRQGVQPDSAAATSNLSNGSTPATAIPAPSTDAQTGSAAAPSTTAPASRATQPAMSGASSANLSAADRHFVEQAALGGAAEVQAGQLAQQKSSNDEVKQFAQQMIDDHGKANDQLKQIASQKGIDIPASDPKADAESKQLDAVNGAAFDRKYAQIQLKDHQQTVKLFQQEAKSGGDPDLKSFASSTLPTLEQHLDHAKQLVSAVGVRSAGNGAGSKSGPSQ